MAIRKGRIFTWLGLLESQTLTIPKAKRLGFPANVHLPEGFQESLHASSLYSLQPTLPISLSGFEDEPLFKTMVRGMHHHGILMQAIAVKMEMVVWLPYEDH